MNLGISAKWKEVLCECEGLTGSDKNRNFEPCFPNQTLWEFWVWSRSRGWWIELSGRMQSKEWILWCQVATLHIPKGMLVFMLMRGWEVLIDQREAWRQVEQIMEDNWEAFIHYFPSRSEVPYHFPSEDPAEQLLYSSPALSRIVVKAAGLELGPLGSNPGSIEYGTFLAFWKISQIRLCLLFYL